MYLSYIKKIWTRGFGLPILFFILERVALCSKHWFFLLNYDLFTKMCPKYFNGKLWPYHLPCFINSFLYDPAYKVLLFQKFIFKLGNYYKFKITSILVRQVISFKKNVDAVSKIYCLISWSPISTPSILVSASMKMAGITAITVWEWTTLTISSYKGKRIR